MPRALDDASNESPGIQQVSAVDPATATDTSWNRSVQRLNNELDMTELSDIRNLNYNYAENSVGQSREATIDERQQQLLKEVQNLELELEL